MPFDAYFAGLDKETPQQRQVFDGPRMSEEARKAERRLHRQAFPEETQIESLETQLALWKAKSSVQNELETTLRTQNRNLLAALKQATAWLEDIGGGEIRFLDEPTVLEIASAAASCRATIGPG